ncbi:DUF3035 domain-containing protein [Pelagibacteraceae bacterium]|nr:DUF3035 domain-containing protein [Pelagibacteraceae bacterium]
MKKIICIIIVSNLILISCNSVRESAGVTRKNIDEYAVVENPPLVIPPDFNLMPPDQIKSKNIDDTEKELAKEILFGLDDEEIQSNSDNSLITEIIKESQGNSVSSNIRSSIDQDFAGIKSSIDDETKFKNEEELNAAIEETKNLNIIEANSEKKEKKKKRFFFF